MSVYILPPLLSEDPHFLPYPQIREHCFPLRPEELEALRRSIEKEGIRDPLVVWPCDEGPVLVDGHHRYEIAKELGIGFKTVEKHFEGLKEALTWIDLNQLGRRNLTDEQRTVVIGRLYEGRKLTKAEAISKRWHGDTVENFSTVSGSAATAKGIAQNIGVNEKTVRNSAKFARAVKRLKEISPKAVERVLKGEVKDAITTLPKIKEEELPDVARGIEEGGRSLKEIKRTCKKTKAARNCREGRKG